MKDLYKKVVNWQPFFYSNSFWLKSSDVFEYLNLITALLLTIVPLGTDLIIKVLPPITEPSPTTVSPPNTLALE